MSYILHIESDQKFEIEGKTASEVQAEIKLAGLMIGNVTLRRMIEGQLESANGFELIEGLSAEEREETQEALDQAAANEVVATDGAGVKEGDGESTPVIDSDETIVQPQGDEQANPETPEVTEEQDAVALARAESVRQRILGNSVADALNEVNSSKDDAVLETALATLKSKSVTPAASTDERKRRHTKREEMVDAARASQHGPILAAVEAGVLPGVFLSYVNPDMRWFQFPVTDLADKDNLHARTNTYIDVAPIVSGGWGFSLYVGAKSFTKRQKIKENDATILVDAINAWLPGALAEAAAAQAAA